MKANVPIILIYSRLVIGFVILTLSIANAAMYKSIAITLLVVGVLTDVFDGIIARRLNISTQHLRRLDSTVDQIFFICVAIATYVQCPSFFKANSILLVILFGSEGLAYVICYFKFKKEIATHTIGAKIWTLLLVATLTQITATCNAQTLFKYCFWIGEVTRLEIIAIILLIKTWTNDVPTVYHAVQLRKGREIKRSKLFNG
jgi:phosphatidylglycerophosphate synthase